MLAKSRPEKRGRRGAVRRDQPLRQRYDGSAARQAACLESLDSPVPGSGRAWLFRFARPGVAAALRARAASAGWRLRDYAAPRASAASAGWQLRDYAAPRARAAASSSAVTASARAVADSDISPNASATA